MKIRVDKIPEEGQDVDAKFHPSDVNLDFHGYTLHEDISFAGRVTKSENDVYVKGTLRGAITSECSRCLTSFIMPVEMKMSVLYVPERDLAAREEEAVEEPETDLSFYKEDAIDLLHEARELLIVNLPLKPVCRQDCKGLCPQCGADLSVAPCGCELHAISSPFEKLKDLKGKLETGSDALGETGKRGKGETGTKKQ